MTHKVKVIHTILWHFCDNSHSGIVGSWDSLEQAEYVLEMLREHGDTMKRFRIQQAMTVE